MHKYRSTCSVKTLQEIGGGGGIFNKTIFETDGIFQWRLESRKSNLPVLWTYSGKEFQTSSVWKWKDLLDYITLHYNIVHYIRLGDLPIPMQCTDSLGCCQCWLETSDRGWSQQCWLKTSHRGWAWYSMNIMGPRTEPCGTLHFNDRGCN